MAHAKKAESIAYTRNQLISSLLKIGHGDLSLYIQDGLIAAQTDPDLFAHLIAWNRKNGKVHDAKVALPILALRGLQPKDKDLAENAVAHLLELSPRELVRAYDFNKKLTQSSVVTSSGTHDFNNKQFFEDILSGLPKVKSVLESQGQRLNFAREKDKQFILREAGIKVHKYPLGISASFRNMMEEGIRRYLKAREGSTKWWDAATLQHRSSMLFLYRMTHLLPNPRAKKILFENDYPRGSVFEAVAQLKDKSPKEAAGLILLKKIPFEVVVGATSAAKNKDIVFALLEGMTGSQLLNNVKWLEEFGVMSDPVLKAAFDAALIRAKADTKVQTLKAGHAATKVKSKTAVAQLGQLQEEKTKQLGSIEGDWLVLGDASSSMRSSIELARKIAGLITERVKGAVYLVFFNESPTFIEVTGLNYQEIVEKTSRINAGGMTSIGCGLDYIRSRKLSVDGIAIATDGGENSAPLFHEAYKKYSSEMGLDPTVYEFWVPGDPDGFYANCERAGIKVEKFNVGSNADYYSLPNIIPTLHTNRYKLFDLIMETPLLTLDSVFERRAA